MQYLMVARQYCQRRHAHLRLLAQRLRQHVLLVAEQDARRLGLDQVEDVRPRRVSRVICFQPPSKVYNRRLSKQGRSRIL
jgi:hypothetical protein